MILNQNLWHNRSFVLFWLGRTVSLAGSAITGVVLPILIYQLTGSALQTSLLTTFNVLPYLIFGLFAGVVADRVNRKRLMVLCDLLNVLLLSSIPIAGLFHLLSLGQIYAVALLSATAFVWFDAANFGALPALVGREQVLQANSLLWSAGTVVEIVGPSLGGLLAATLGPATAISLDSFSYLLSAIVLLLIVRSFNSVRVSTNETGTLMQRTSSEIGEGLKFLWSQRLVRTLTLLGLGTSFTSGAVVSLLVVYAVRGLHVPQNDFRIGLLYTAGATGALLASLLLPWLVKRVSVAKITLVGLFANLLCLSGVILAPNFASGLVIFALWHACHTLIVINGISLRQIVTPEHLLGRVNVTARMIAWGGAPFGAIVGGALAEIFDIRVAYAIMAVGVLVSAVLGWFSPLRESIPTASVERVEMISS
ncbi:MAG: MFS transporter [Chloroflexi bacterium]|nr:MFS transporter [Chloroflexota bacterium]